MTATRPALCALLLLAVVGGCKRDDLSGVTGGLRFDPANLEFAPTYADRVTRQREVSVVNEGRAAVEVSWAGLAGPFEADLPASLPPGATTLIIRLTPTVAGRFSQLVEVQAGTGGPASLALDATVNDVPACAPSNPCVSAHFNLSSEQCEEEALGEGTPCDPGSLCLLNAHCSAGRCVGEARTCKDGNRCTIDVCYPLTGCEFLPAPPCPGDGRCLEGVCDPASGCGLQPRPDGVSCGGSNTGSCTAVDVCIEGACVVRDPPDGYVCEEASPCNDEGRCVSDVCSRATPARALAPSWQLDTLALGDVDAGILAPRLHDFVLEATGELSLSGFFDVPAVLRANSSAAVTAPLGASRRCILWNTRYVCADYPASPNGKVSALELGTGATAWTFDIRLARPDFLEVASTIFLARLVVQGSDRLAAVFEAYPRNAVGDANTTCRRYFLAVIDASGRLVQAQQVTDPLLDVCNHPHPYGVAADAAGNLFIAFSPTVSNSAPLVPADTTLIMSYSRDGVFRWKRLNVGVRGGELAVARGLLYAEYTSVVLDAVSGQPTFALPSVLGRAVVSQSRLIPAPVEDGNTLTGFEAGALQLRWTATLPGPWRFWSDQLRLAKWQTSKGPRTVALTWVKDETGGLQPTYGLYGFDVQDGSRAFLCAVGLPARTPPQLFEVANGSLGVMNGALDPSGNPGCTKCDPPLAGSAGAFFSVPTSKLSVADEPWVGTFGGAGHDHREN